MRCLMSVVLPQPFGPIRAVWRPASIVRLIPLRTSGACGS